MNLYLQETIVNLVVKRNNQMDELLELERQVQIRKDNIDALNLSIKIMLPKDYTSPIIKNKENKQFVLIKKENEKMEIIKNEIGQPYFKID